MKLYLEEGFPRALIAEELKVSTTAIDNWVGIYRRFGEEGLKDRRAGHRRARLPEPVRDKIIELKKEEPARGIKRISQLLKEILSNVVFEGFGSGCIHESKFVYAATFFSSPSTKTMPSITLARNSEPFRRRQFF